jgi:putative addiction module component (TIGR02574 family)
MPAIDYSHMTPAEKLDLIGEIWDSMEADAIPLTDAQAAELDSRLAMLAENPKDGRDGYEVLADLRRRFG